MSTFYQHDHSSGSGAAARVGALLRRSARLLQAGLSKTYPEPYRSNSSRTRVHLFFESPRHIDQGKYQASSAEHLFRVLLAPVMVNIHGRGTVCVRMNYPLTRVRGYTVPLRDRGHATHYGILMSITKLQKSSHSGGFYIFVTNLGLKDRSGVDKRLLVGRKGTVQNKAQCGQFPGHMNNMMFDELAGRIASKLWSKGTYRTERRA